MRFASSAHHYWRTVAATDERRCAEFYWVLCTVLYAKMEAAHIFPINVPAPMHQSPATPLGFGIAQNFEPLGLMCYKLSVREPIGTTDKNCQQWTTAFNARIVDVSVL